MTHIGTNTTISVAISSRSLPNVSNPCQIVDDERERLISYKKRREEESLLIQQFLDSDMCNSSSPTVSKSYPKRKRQKTIFLMANHPSNTNKKVVIKQPKKLKHIAKIMII